jgi:hypothetical protein
MAGNYIRKKKKHSRQIPSLHPKHQMKITNCAILAQSAITW